MNELKIFQNSQFGEVRVITVNNEPYCVGKDVAEILGYERADNAIRNHVDEDDKLMHQISASGQNRQMYIINESGLYSLILSSKLPTAKQFKRWVTSEVLPSIRKHGMYAADELLANPDFAIKVFEALKKEREARKAAEALNEANKPKVIFADAVDVSHTSILIGDLAKLLKQNGIETGQKRLFEYLRENGYLIKSGSSKNMPTQRSMDLHLFEVKENTISNPDGSVRITRTTKVTGKGQIYFTNHFLKMA